ncbi:hypothetical protein JTE90_018714 [Oedothorax gibbosus]|uniref:Uncharacterized protein n=1 Tax=Oedothorax gibbosus TaxID=931172 RepID=A0AAV6TYS6_9ARAC|nr:hypothetical protein JTE90_018714 [Oedothorax gibbosus]
MAGEYFEQTLAKGVIGSFQTSLQDIYKLALVSNANCEVENRDKCEILEHLKEDYDIIKHNFTDYECAKFVESLRILPDVEFSSVEKIEDGHLKDLCRVFKELHDVLEKKLHAETESWMEYKQKKSSQFVHDMAKCQEELQQVQKELEMKEEKIHKTESSDGIEDQVNERDQVHAKDFQSLKPFYLMANENEKVEFIEKVGREKLSYLRKKLDESERKVKEVSGKYNWELWEIVEETMKMKYFSEWVKSQYEIKIRYFDDKLDKLWKEFKQEMQECRELCKKYKVLDPVYVKILDEQREKQIQNEKKRNEAAATIQAHIRGFLVRSRMKKLVENLSVGLVSQDL